MGTGTATAVVGVDIGTSSSKGVLVDPSGRVLSSATREHDVQRPRSGWVEMDPQIWWSEFTSIVSELLHDNDVTVSAIGVSGMGPCVALADEEGDPVRPAILYGIDTRATSQIERLDAELGTEEILQRCGSALSTQAAGPKIAWVADNEPEAYARARMLLMPSSLLVYRLTGAYVLDHHSASQSTPLYNTEALDWYEPWVAKVAPGLHLPELKWPGEIAGVVTAEAAQATGLLAGTPVITGTIDAWSEALSVGAHGVGDLMLMYGTTMFLINTVAERVTSPTMWGTVGALPDTRNLAGGMATSGAITSWLKEIFGAADFTSLIQLAAESGVGARGLLMLPYFAGERTPIADPDARGLIAGLTLSHGRGDLYRAALEATAFGVRHNIEAIEEAGGRVHRVVAVGGGTQGGLWTQIVSDVTGRSQVIPSQLIGASYGAAFLAASATGDADIAIWNPPAAECHPDPDRQQSYEQVYELFRTAYPATVALSHALAQRQHNTWA